MAEIKTNKPINADGAVTADMINRLLAEGNVEKARALLEIRRGLLDMQSDNEQAQERARIEEQRLVAIQEDIERKEQEQNDCPHTKPNGYPAIGGIRDSKNNTHYLCTRCQKMWMNDALPMHLRQNLNPIGGPQY